MRLHEFYQHLAESGNTDTPSGIGHTMPRTVIFPDMDLYYEYYKFVTAMASHPELDNAHTNDRPLRDVPMAVAYTPEEYDMIMATAKRMGFKAEDVSSDDSREPPGGNTESPVMKFNMFESQAEQMRSILEGIK